jgi:hypothetical protein
MHGFTLKHFSELNPKYIYVTAVPLDLAPGSGLATALCCNTAFVRNNLPYTNAWHNGNYYRIKSNSFQCSYTHNLIAAEYNSLSPEVHMYPQFRVNLIYKMIFPSCSQQTNTRT